MICSRNALRSAGHGAEPVWKDEDGIVDLCVRGTFETAKVGVLAVDCPLGPYHFVKDGAIGLASEIKLLSCPFQSPASPSVS